MDRSGRDLGRALVVYASHQARDSSLGNGRSEPSSQPYRRLYSEPVIESRMEASSRSRSSDVDPAGDSRHGIGSTPLAMPTPTVTKGTTNEPCCLGAIGLFEPSTQTSSSINLLPWQLARLGTMAGFQGSTAHRSSDRQSLLATVLWHRLSQDCRRLWIARRNASLR